MATSYNKNQGYLGENIAQEYYEWDWYTCREKNFTIRWGEIDLVMENSTDIIFVEVKVVNYIDNLHDYITAKKLVTLKHTIETYLWKYPTKKIVRVDVIFIKNKEIVTTVKNIEL